MIRRLLPLLPLLLLATPSLRAQENEDPFAAASAATGDPVTPSLVAENTAIVPGQKFAVALKLVHQEHWHTFWRNGGWPAQATEVNWILPPGVTATQTLWPVPRVFPTELDSVQHFLEGTTYIVGEFTAPATLQPGEKLKLGAEVFYQFCKEDECRTAEPKLSIELTAAPDAQPGKDAPAIQAVRAAQPQATPAWKTSITPAGADTWTLRAEPGPGAAPDPGTLYFFDASSLTESVPQKWTTDGPARTLTLKTDPAKAKTAAGRTPWGFLHASGTWLTGSTLASIPVGDPAAAPANTSGTATPAGDAPKATLTAEDEALIQEIRSWGVSKKQITWWYALVLAFLGGIILNLMPCVFPVLGIKILGFVRQSGENPAVVKKHGLVYAAGVIASILALAIILLAVRKAGESAGWGFQLQNPAFLAGLIIIVFAFALSLTGLFEIGTKLTSVGAELQDAAGYKGSFFSGLLTVLLATPCTGPFMGPALGFALDKTTHEAIVLLVFLFLALGLALPYVILSWFPALVKKLPRPGAWMETFKQFMAFPMLATVAWLLSVLSATTGSSGITHLLFALILLGITLWLYGRFFQRTAKVRSRTLAALTALAALLGAASLTKTAIGKIAPPIGRIASAELIGHDAEPLSPKVIVERRQKGLYTVVDFWATWCLQCELNREAAFDRTTFREALPQYDAIFMLGDKSTRGSLSDKLTDKFLTAYSQGGIPYALVIPPKGPVIELPSVIGSPDVIIDALKEARKQTESLSR